MTKKLTGTAAIGAAIGSAAIAAALLYANNRRNKGNKPKAPDVVPPETD